MKNVYGITIDNNYIQLGSTEHEQELKNVIEKLKQRGVKEERYKDIEKKLADFFQYVCNSDRWASSFKIFNLKIKSGIIAAFYRYHV